MARAIRMSVAKPGVWNMHPRRFRGIDDIARFACNICGHHVEAPVSVLRDRELPSCSQCGSNRRFRTMIYGLSLGLFGRPLALPDFPKRRDLSGIGLSDTPIYGKRLRRKFAYKNTFLHRSPFLDITNIGDTPFEDLDFVIASDVFEHVAPPIQSAFTNVRTLLKPGGLFVFSAPYGLDVTTEHYPDLHEFSIQRRRGSYRLLNRTNSGRVEAFDNLVFHGGPGSTLEMRIFGLKSLYTLFDKTGFSVPRLLNENVPDFGIEYTDEVCSIPMYAHAV
jgi:SAM-dependent methyltransferase